MKRKPKSLFAILISVSIVLQPLSNCFATVISSVAASSITSTGATITWTTDVTSNSQVEYGLTASYGSSTTVNTSLVLSHSQALTGLTASTLYHYRVRSKDGANNLAISGDFTFTTISDVIPPVLSSIAASNITSNGATISWGTNENADSQVEYGLTTSYGASTTLDTTKVTTHSQNVSGLGSNAVYHYRVKSRDAAGNLATSSDFTFSTDITAPSIFNVAASGITSTGVTINWGTDENSTSQVEFGPTGSYGSLSSFDSTLLTSHYVSLSGLTPSTLYHYRAKSKDPANNLANSGDFTFTTTSAPDTTPPTVSSVTASNITSGNATITWITNESADSQVEYGPTTSYGSFSSYDSQLFVNHTSYLYGLASNALYHYRVKSRDAAGNLTTSGDFTFNTTGTADTTPPSLSSVYATAITASGATITWSTDESADSQVEYGLTTSYGSYSTYDSQLFLNHTIYLYGLSSNSPYHYRVRSRDAAGNLATSADFTFGTSNAADTTPPSIYNVFANAITASGATITWSTDESADSQVEYGLTTAYGNFSNFDSQLFLNHTSYLYGLTSNTLYHYRVRSHDAAGNYATSTDFTFNTTGAADTTPPSLYNVFANNITAAGATITWGSDESSDSQVEYGPTTAYGSFSNYDSQLFLNHTSYLYGLASNMLYHYRVKSRDAAGNLATSGDFTFNTTGSADTTPPSLFNIFANNITATGATITWGSDESSDSQVEYGPTTAYGNFSNYDSQLFVNHTSYLYSLASNTLYHYRVRSKDAAGNLTTSADFTFNTTGSADTTPPSLYNVFANNITAAGATITWGSDESSDSQVEYGPTTAYGSFSNYDSQFFLNHTMNLYGLNSNLLYHYRVKSRDAAGNLATSGDFTFTTTGSADTTPPSLFNIFANNITATGATITWGSDESSDSQVEYGPTTAYGNFSNYDSQLFVNHTSYLYSLASNTLYHYRVRSKDAAGNLTNSADFTFNTTGSADTTPPSLYNIFANNITAAGATITWSSDESSDSQVEYGSTTAYGSFSNYDSQFFLNHTMNLYGLNSNLLYHYRVKSRDAAGNLATSGDFTFTTTGSADTTPPSLFNIFANNITATGATITWGSDESSDSQVEYGPTTAYGNFSNYDSQLFVNHTSYLYSLASNTLYHYRVRSKDAAGNLTTSADFTFNTTGSADTTPPSLYNIFANNITAAGATITWSSDESSDSQVEYGSTTAYGSFSNYDSQFFLNHTMNLYGLNSNLLYHYRVKSRDAAGNLATSGDFTFTTTGAADTTPPSLYNVFANNITAAGATITWGSNESADSQVEYGSTTAYGSFSNYDSQLFVNHTSYLYSLASNMLYHYRVRSKDAAGNLTISADFTFNTTGAADTTPPSLYNIFATNITAAGATITWSSDESSDSQVEYGSTTAYGSFSNYDSQFFLNHTMNLYGLNSNLLYHYRVKSRDAAGNLATSGDFTFTTTSAADTTPPSLFNIFANNITATGATITWGSNESADSQVEYGSTTAYGSFSNYDSQLFVNHTSYLYGLASNTLYHYRVKSRDAAGNLTTSADFTFNTTGTADITPPSLYNIFANAITATGATISWSSDESSNSQVEYGTTTAYGSFSNFDSQFFLNHVMYLNGLNPNSLYHYRVKSRDAAGNLAASGDFTFTTTGAADITPPSLFNIFANAITGSGATITWGSNESADSQVEYGLTTAYGSFTNYDSQLFLNHTSYLYGLASNSLYHYRVRSKDAAGNLAISADFTFYTTGSVDTTPPSLYNIFANAVTSNGATISWSSDKSATSQVEYGLTTAYGSYSMLDSQFFLNHVMYLYGLNPNSLYHFRVTSRDAAGNLATSGDFTLTTTGSADTTPPALFNIFATNITASGATISWTSDKSADSQVEYGPLSAYTFLTPINTQLQTAHVVVMAGLSANSTYHYRVRSRDAAGNIALSADFTFMTSASVDTTALTAMNIMASAVTANTASITWMTNKPADARVEYGVSTAYGFLSANDPSLMLTHNIFLPGLTANTLYHYRVKSLDSSGNFVASADFSFMTSNSADTTAPLAYGVGAFNITSNGTSISWTTDKPTNSQVEYGATTAYGSLSIFDSQLFLNHTMYLYGLAASTLYHYRVKCRDAAGNLTTTGDFTFTTSGVADTTPPAATNNLSAQSGSGEPGTVQLTWTASGDDGIIGRASLYTIRYSYAPISEATWYQAQIVPGTIQPQLPGTAESFTVRGLVPGQNYYFAIKTYDAIGNQSAISNIPSALSFSGCSAGSGDGAGMMTVNQPQVLERKSTNLTFTYTAAAAGMSQGGFIELIPPAGWPTPQKFNPTGAGYVTATTPNANVTLNSTFINQALRIMIDYGSLAVGDHVTITYQAQAPCGVVNNIPFVVNTQGNACGIPTKIASFPTVSVALGEAAMVEFNAYEKYVDVGNSASFKVQGKGTCGALATFTGNTNVTLLADAQGLLSTTNDFSGGLTTLNVTFLNGESEKTIYYKLVSNSGAALHYVRSQFYDLQQNYLTERYLSMIPALSGQTQFLSNATIDKGQAGGTLKTVGIANNEMAFVNYTLGNPISSDIRILNASAQTVYQAYMPAQTSIRFGWAGQNFSYQSVPTGNYQVVITAGAETDNSLTIQVQNSGLTGHVTDSKTSSVISFAQVQVYSNGLTRYASTDSNGDFTIAGLSGDCTIKILKPNYVAYQQNKTISGNLNLGNIALDPMAQIVMVATRSGNLNVPVYGRMIARSANKEYVAPFVSDVQSAIFKDPTNQNSPSVFVDPGVAFTVSFEGIVVSPVQLTLAAGDVYNLNPTVTYKNAISGQITIPAGKSVSTHIHIQATNTSNSAITIFADTDIPAFETTASYSFPPVFESGKSYLLETFADGFEPLRQNVDVANVDVIQNLTLSSGQNLTVTLAFPGNSTSLGATFPVNLRIVAANGVSITKTTTLTSDASSTSGTIVFNGLKNAQSYRLYYDPIFGRELATPGAQNVTINGDTALTLTFLRQSGAILATVVLANGSSINSVQAQITKGSYVDHAPTISGSTMLFDGLEAGVYDLSIFDPAANSSKFVAGLSVTNGQVTPATVALSGVQLRSIGGTVYFRASPPLQSEAAVIANGTNLTIYTPQGTQSITPLKMMAIILGPNNERVNMPTTAQDVWDKSRLIFADISGGTYNLQIPNGARAVIRPNTDLLNADGRPDIASAEQIISVSADVSNLDFTLTDGSKILVSINSTDATSDSTVGIQLIDPAKRMVLSTEHVTLVAGQGTCSFEHLSPGNYLVKLEGQEGVNLVAKDQFVSITTFQDQRPISFTLEQGAQVLFKVSDPAGRILTSQDDLASKLKAKFTIIGGQHVVIASGPDLNGGWTASLIRGVGYTLRIDVDETSGYNVLGLEKKVKCDGSIFDGGVLPLQKGTELSGVVVDGNGNPLQQIPVTATPAFVTGRARITYTNNLGAFTFGDLDLKERYYDVFANPRSEQKLRNPKFSEYERKLIDLTKLNELGSFSFTLDAVSGSLVGNVISLSNTPLTYQDGNDVIPGAKLIVKNQGKTIDFETNPAGDFNIPLQPGTYQMRVAANGHKLKDISDISVQAGVVNLGNIPLEAGVVTLKGLLRTADGTPPDSKDIQKILAKDAKKKIYDAELIKLNTSVDANDTSTSDSEDQKIDSYIMNGLEPGLVIDIYGINSDNQPKLLGQAITVPAADFSLDLACDKNLSELTASFTLKIPERNAIDVDFKLTENIYEGTEDLDGNGIPDSAEYDKDVTVKQGYGTVAFVEKSSKKNLKYSYALGSGDGTAVNTLTLGAAFKTEKIDAKGENVVAKGDFSYPFGLKAQRKEIVSPLTDSRVKLADGSEVLLTQGWTDSTGTIEVTFQSADLDMTSFNAANAKSSGRRAISLANKLGARAYPADMYKAIKALEAMPDIDPFASFYDIFLPAGVSHVFGNTKRPNIKFAYDADADPSKINVYYYNPEAKIYLLENNNRVVDTVAKTISVDVSHFSVFTVLASNAPVIRSSGNAGSLEVFNFPNPFDLNQKAVTLKNPGSSGASQLIQGTMIKIDVPPAMTGTATIKIFDMASELVRTLHADDLTAGTYNYVEWDGTNDHGENVASGVYIGRLEISSQTKTFKMAVVK